MSALVTAAVVTAGASAYGAYSSNKAQKEAAKQQQAQAEAAAGPRTNTPYAPAEPHVQRALEEAGRLYDQGLHQEAAKLLRSVPGASEALQGLIGDVTDRARNPSPTLAAGQGFVQDLLGGGGGTQFEPRSWAESYMPKWMRDQGLGAEGALQWARENPTSQFGQMLASAEGAAKAAGPAGPFARNPIYNELYGSTTGTNMDRSFDLLSDFIGGGGGAGFTPSGGSLTPAGGDQGAPGAAEPEYEGSRWKALGYGSRKEAQAAMKAAGGGGKLKDWLAGQPLPQRAAPAPAGGGGDLLSGGGAVRPSASTMAAYRTAGSGNGGVIPDTMAQGGFFADQARKFFDPSVLDPANDPTLQPYVEALRKQLGDTFTERADLIGDRFSNANSFNSSARSLALGKASGELSDAEAAELARVYMGSRESALGRQMNLLGGISQRDLAAMGDLTQRYGIDTSADVARSGIASSAGTAKALQDAELAYRREALASGTDLATRAQNLQAILGVQGGDQFGMSLLSGLGGALDSRQFGALGAIPAMEGVDQGWYGMALGGQEGVDRLRQGAASANRGNAAASALAPGADLDDYLRRIMGPASAFSTQTGTAPAYNYSGPSSGEALAGGLLGGAAAGFGTYMQLQGQQQPRNPPVTASYDYFGDYGG